MSNSKINLCILILMLMAGSLSAEPIVKSECCQPKPVGGMQQIEALTIYPLWAEKERIDSDVILSFHVDSKGKVSDMRIAHSGGVMFDESAIMAVMNTEWLPARQANQAIGVTFELPFKYRAD